MAFRLKLLPALFSIPSIIIMLSLGTWQMDRLIWKQNLIDLLKNRTSAPAVLLPDYGITQAKDEFRPVFVEGHFDYDNELLLQNRIYKKQAGLHILTPFIRSDGKGTLLVDRGWVPFDATDPSLRQESKVDGTIRLEGVIRFPIGQTFFVPDNNPAKGHWYFIDLDAMGAQVNQDFSPYYIMAGLSDIANILPIGGRWKISLPNNHLVYALTWYSLAVILFVIFVLYHRKKP